MTKRSVYLDVADAANPSLRNRKPVVRKNGQSRILRRYHLLSNKLVALQDEIKRTGKFVSPYGPNRLYTMVIDSLIHCGENHSHPVNQVFTTFKDLMNDPSTVRGGETAWDRFNKKSPRNENTHLTAFPRFIYNLEVLQRLGGDHPYGLKLAQLGACIDIHLDAQGMLLVKLRTNIPEGSPVQPINTNRKRKPSKTVSSVPSGLVLDKPENEQDSDDSDSEEND